MEILFPTGSLEKKQNLTKKNPKINFCSFPRFSNFEILLSKLFKSENTSHYKNLSEILENQPKWSESSLLRMLLEYCQPPASLCIFVFKQCPWHLRFDIITVSIVHIVCRFTDTLYWNYSVILTAMILVKDVPECNNYKIIYDASRRVNHNITKPSSSCDRHLVENGTWYRFDESKILQHVCPNLTSHYCGVDHPGYFTQPHPSAADGVKEIRIYYYYFYCSGDYGTALVRNCASFLVYKSTYLPFWIVIMVSVQNM